MIGAILDAFAHAGRTITPYIFTVLAILAASAGVLELTDDRGWALIVIAVGALAVDYQREQQRNR